MNKNNFKKCIAYISLAASFWAFNSNNVIADDKPPNNQNIPQQPKVHPLAENLSKIGAFSCAERANQMANFLSATGKSQLVLQTPADKPNQRLLMASLITPTAESNFSIANISLAPNQANGCGGSYQSVSYLFKSCKTAIEAYPIKFQKIENTNVSIGLVSRGLWLTAMPADKGCIIIKQELIDN